MKDDEGSQVEPRPSARILSLLPRGAEERLARIPPYNTEAEQALLGAILVENRVLEMVVDFLRPEHFGNAVHGRIFAAARKTIETGATADPITLRSVFDRDEALQATGGSRYLMQLATSVITLRGAEDYGRLIHDLYLRRELIKVGEGIVEGAYRVDLDDPAAGQLDRAEAELYSLAETDQIGSGFAPIAGAMEKAIAAAAEAYKRGARITGVPTGFAELDKLLSGLHPSDLVVLAGRPAMGKSALATNIAFNAAQSGDAGGIFSLEMASDQLGARILGEVTGIASDWVRRGDLNQEQFDRLLEAQGRFGAVPLWIDDTPALSVAGLRSRARRLKRRHSLDLLIVDYLQLLQTAQPSAQRNRVQEISEITRGLKSVAKELNLPVLAVSQLSRAVESRDDKRPLLSDLRESGSIEQDADVVIFIFREEYYLREPDPADLTKWAQWRDRMAAVRNKAELIVAKNRHGAIGTVNLYFDHRTTRFSNLSGA